MPPNTIVAAGINVEFDDEANKFVASQSNGVSVSLTVKPNVNVPSSDIDLAVIAAIVGGSSIATTSSWKVVLAVKEPSVTVNVISLVPD